MAWRAKIPLRSRLMLGILLAIIPLNILVVLFSISMLDATVQEARMSASRELESICSRIDTDIDMIANRIDALTRQFRLEFWELETASADNITVHTVWQVLRDTWQGSEFFSAAYLMTHWDQHFVLTHDTAQFTLDDIDRLREPLAEHAMHSSLHRQLSPLTVEGDVYFIFSFQFANFAYGFIIKASAIFEALKPALHPNESLYILMSDAVLISEPYAYVASLGNYFVIEHSFQDGSFTLQRRMPQTVMLQSVTVLQVLLLTLASLTVFSVPFTWYNIRKQVLEPLRSLEIESYEKEIERLRTEAINLRLQVSPHMLLNSLNMIYNLAESQSFEWVQNYTRLLMNYFRYALRENHDTVPLHKEIQFVRDFFEIQKIRYPDMLVGDFTFEEVFANTPIPPFIIQNFVENSVKHGMVIGKVMESQVSVKRHRGNLVITITDNGAGIEPEIMEQIRAERQVRDKNGTHIGIWNCMQRLKLYYNEEARFHIESSRGSGTKVVIEIMTEFNRKPSHC